MNIYFLKRLVLLSIIASCCCVLAPKSCLAVVLADFEFTGSDYSTGSNGVSGANTNLNLSSSSATIPGLANLSDLLASPGLDLTAGLSGRANDYDNALGFSRVANSDGSFGANNQTVYFNLTVAPGYELSLTSLQFDSLKSRGSNATGSRSTHSLFVNPAGNPALDGLIGDTDQVTNGLSSAQRTANFGHDHFAPGVANAESTGPNFSTGRTTFNSFLGDAFGEINLTQYEKLTGTVQVALRTYSADGNDWGLDDIRLKGHVAPIPTAGSGRSLLVDPSEHQALRDKVSQGGAWASMRNWAVNWSQNNSYNPNEPSINTRQNGFNTSVGAASLAYILDPGNQALYRSRITSAISQVDTLETGAQTSWQYNVKAGNSLFEAILALDVIRSDLSAGDLATLEAKIETEVYSFSDPFHVPSSESVQALWHLYKEGDSASFRAKRDYFLETLDEFTSPDGAFYPGVGYSNARNLGSDRKQKHLLAHVLEKTGTTATGGGEIESVYDWDEQQKKAIWIAGYSHTPTKHAVQFGDTVSNFIDKTPRFSYTLHTFGNYSEKAGAYAAALSDHISAPIGTLENFVLYDPVEARLPSGGLILPDGGAFFLPHERTGDRDLYGAMWHTSQEDGHSHADVNALFLSGYGENLLGNSGFNGFGSGVSVDGATKSWEWISSNAEANNTVLINGNGAQAKADSTPVTGFSNAGFAYSRGNYDDADGDRNRNFMFIPASDGAGGYWAVIDEIDATQAGADVNVVLHPTSTDVTTLSAGESYDWTINRFGNEDVHLNIFLGTAASSVELRDGIQANGGDSFRDRYLYTHHTTDSQGQTGIVTLLLPREQGQTAPAAQRISGTGYTGAQVTQGNVRDVIVESAYSSVTTTVEGISYQGNGLFLRYIDGQLASFNAVQAEQLNAQAALGTSFTASNPITLYLRDNSGSVSAEQTTSLTINRTGLSRIYLDGIAMGTGSSTGQANATVTTTGHSLQLRETTTDQSMFRAAQQTFSTGHSGPVTNSGWNAHVGSTGAMAGAGASVVVDSNDSDGTGAYLQTTLAAGERMLLWNELDSGLTVDQLDLEFATRSDANTTLQAALLVHDATTNEARWMIAGGEIGADWHDNSQWHQASVSREYSEWFELEFTGDASSVSDPFKMETFALFAADSQAMSAMQVLGYGVYASVAEETLGGTVRLDDFRLNVFGGVLAGDFNRDGMVDAADYTVWRDGLGTTYDADDYDLWRQNFGNSLPMNLLSSAATSQAVPEPAFGLLLLVALTIHLANPRKGLTSDLAR